MHTLIALALATPVWGFALEPPVLAGVSILPECVFRAIVITRIAAS